MAKKQQCNIEIDLFGIVSLLFMNCMIPFRVMLRKPFLTIFVKFSSFRGICSNPCCPLNIEYLLNYLVWPWFVHYSSHTLLKTDH